ncbi:hypothetical protein MAHJHV63_50460 [Mycobacterium avium subsp. hominissuis]
MRGAAHSITAAGASAILVMGFPVLLKLTSAELGAGQLQQHRKPHHQDGAGAAHSITAAGASAILVMGFPVLLKLTSAELGARVSVTARMITPPCAPLLVPLTAMQGNLIAHFVDERSDRVRAPIAPTMAAGPISDRVRALIGPAAIVGAIGAVGVLAEGDP